MIVEYGTYMSEREKKKYLKRIKRPVHLYHISLKNHDGEVFKPRVPEDFGNNEDYTIPRVCFSSTISGAYRAITFEDIHGEDCYVHVPENAVSLFKNGNVYKPGEELVWDTYFTDEYWVKRPVKMKCIGKARFYYKESLGLFCSGPWRPPVKFKWLEKYN